VTLSLTFRILISFVLNLSHGLVFLCLSPGFCFTPYPSPYSFRLGLAATAKMSTGHFRALGRSRTELIAQGLRSDGSRLIRHPERREAFCTCLAQ
jgi:hypothetical protein